MTIRVLDDAVYEEQLIFDNPDNQHDVVLEAVGNARLSVKVSKLAHTQSAIWIRGVPNVTLRNLRLVVGPESWTQVYLTDHCPGVVVDGLKVTADGSGAGVELQNVALRDEDKPIEIHHCQFQEVLHGVRLEGRLKPDEEGKGKPMGRVIIRNNKFIGCGSAMFLAGEVYDIHAVGNTIQQCRWAAIEVVDPVEGAAGLSSQTIRCGTISVTCAFGMTV